MGGAGTSKEKMGGGGEERDGREESEVVEGPPSPEPSRSFSSVVREGRFSCIPLRDAGGRT